MGVIKLIDLLNKYHHANIKTLMYHKVEDFEKWKKAFEQFFHFRKSSGERSFSLGTLHNQPNTAYVINEWESPEVFQKFVNSPDLANAMKSAGVVEKPHLLILQEVENG